MRLEELPRIKVADLPTPLEELKNLRKAIGGPRLFIKRDDKTGLAYGGNKLRKLEFLMADALSKGADTIITSGAVQTNHGRLTAAMAAKLGLRCILVITEEEPEKYEGNLILEKLFGAELHFLSISQDIEEDQRAKEYLKEGDKFIADLTAKLKMEGRKPYIIPRGGRSLQGTASYAVAMIELYSQLIEKGIKADYIVLPVATCSTMTGVLLGTKIVSLNSKVVGISVSRSAEEGKDLVLEEFTKDAAFLGYDFSLSREEIIVTDDYLGEGYGSPTKEGIGAMNLLARKEAIILDPVYTGKAMGGLLDMVKKGYFKETDHVVFIHTGGGPTLFAQENNII